MNSVRTSTTFFILVAFLSCAAWQCTPTAGSNKGLQKGNAATVRSGNTLPIKWPWRGVSIESRYTRPDEIPYLASTGLNFIRIQIKSDKRALRENSPAQSSFQAELLWVDSILDAIRFAGITSMIAFNNPVLDPNSKIDKTTASFWKSGTELDSAQRLFNQIIKRYKNKGEELAAYEFMSEPVIRSAAGGINPPGLETFSGRILDNLRAVDTTRWMLLSTGPWGKPTNYEGFKPYAFRDSKVFYGAHMYLPDAYTHQGVRDRPLGVSYPGIIRGERWDARRLAQSLRALRSFSEKNGYPVFIGEFQAVRWAPNADLWVKDVSTLFEDYGWSWAYFAYGAGQHFWDPFYNHKIGGKEKNLKYVGPETPVWKFMCTQFDKNRQP
ncbi:MAG: glycoside hydrolase family 5 protein [Bacteroidota bacterium]